jgi:hypothetical protein
MSFEKSQKSANHLCIIKLRADEETNFWQTADLNSRTKCMVQRPNCISPYGPREEFNAKAASEDAVFVIFSSDQFHRPAKSPFEFGPLHPAVSEVVISLADRAVSRLLTASDFCPPADILNTQLIHYKVIRSSYPFKHPRGYTYTSWWYLYTPYPTKQFGWLVELIERIWYL